MNNKWWARCCSPLFCCFWYCDLHVCIVVHTAIYSVAYTLSHYTPSWVLCGWKSLRKVMCSMCSSSLDDFNLNGSTNEDKMPRIEGNDSICCCINCIVAFRFLLQTRHEFINHKPCNGNVNIRDAYGLVRFFFSCCSKCDHFCMVWLALVLVLLLQISQL